MPATRLYRLHLGKSILYREAAAQESPDSGYIPESEYLFVFDDHTLLDQSSGQGPLMRNPPAQAIFSGKNAETAEGGTSATCYTLKPGEYVFCQWRKKDFSAPRSGLEEFARQVWWEGEKTEGPWFLRIVAEDGDIAYQGLRKIAGG